MKVEFPADAVEGDKAEITFTDEGNNPVKAVYEKQADGSWNRIPAESQNVPNELPTTVPSTAPSFVIPEDKLKDGTAVTAKSIDVAGNDTDATPVNAGFDEPVRTPVLEAGYPKSQSNSGDPDTDAADQAVLVGTANPNAVIKVQDKDGNPLTPTATANDEGKFTLTIPKADLAKGPFKLIAELTENGTTESSNPTDPIAVEQTVQPGTPVANPTDEATPSTDKGGYPNDNTPPPAPTINTGLDGAAKVTVGLPADAKNGDKVTITYTDEDNNPQTVVVTKAQDGWKVPENSPISQDKINGNNLEIPADSVKDNSEVTARTQDLAGNLSKKNKDTSKYDEVTATPSLTVNAIDTAEKADNTIDALVVTGKVLNEANASVGLLNGSTKLVELGSALNTDTNGDYKAVLVKKGTETAVVDKLKAKYPGHTIIEVDTLPTGELTAIAQKSGKAQSPNTNATIPTTLDSNTTDHPLDAANPTAPTLKAHTDGERQGSVDVTFPADAVAGDKVTVNFVPTGETDSVPVTYVKQTDNTWKADPEKTATDKGLPATVATNGVLTIPAAKVADNTQVTATATDLAGKTAAGVEANGTSTSVTTATDPRQTTKPTITEIKVADTDQVGDKSPETVTIKGTIAAPDQNAEVTLYNKAGDVIAKVTANNGNFEFTLTKGDTATPTGDQAPTDGRATLTEIPTADTTADFTVKAKSTGASLSNAENVNLPSLDQPMKQQTLEVYSDGTDELKAGDKVGLFNKEGQQIATATVTQADGNQSGLGKFKFTLNKGNAASNNNTADNVTLTEIPDSKDLVVKKLPAPATGATATPAENTPVTFYTKGKISGTEEKAGTPKETITRADTTPNDLSVELNPTILNGKAYDVTKATGTGFDTKAETKNKQESGLSIDIRNEPKEGDVLTVTVKTPAKGNEQASEKAATFTYSNGVWTETSDADNLYADVPKSANGSTELNNADILKQLKAGDEVTVTIQDVAGNSASSRKIVSDDFTNADAPVVKVGSRTTEPKAQGETDPNAADRLVTNFASETETTKPSAVNSGDVYFRPGENNVKLAVGYLTPPTTGATGTGTQPAEPTETTIYGKRDEQTGKWTFHTADNGGGETVSYITEVVGQDGYVYYRIPADKVADGSGVTVIGTNDNAQSFVPAEGAPTETDNPVNPKLAYTSVVADMDDKTDNAVGEARPAQDNADSHIIITPTSADDKDGDSSNNTQTADANKVAVKFDVPTNLTVETAKHLGLKVNVAQPGGQETVAQEQYIVAVKQPNGTWTLHTTDANSFDEALKTPAGDQGDVSPAIAEVDASGVITLKKDVVKGRSSVQTQSQDPYGHTHEGGAFATQHNDAPTPLVVVDEPRISKPGFGTLVVSPGNNNESMDIQVGTNGEIITVTKQSDGTYSITSPSTTPAGSLPQGVKDFDPNTGRITLTSETKQNVTVTGKKQGGTDAVVNTDIDPTFDPSPETVDPIESILAVNGAVEIKPGADNTKLTVKYQHNDGSEQTVTLNKSNGQWTADKNAEDFDINPAKGTITLKQDKVKDGSTVKAQGTNAANNSNDEVEATAGMYDATPNAADQPDAKAGDKGNVVVDKGTDNVKVEIEYSPRAQPTTGTETKEKITALYDIATNKWKLVDSDNLPVDKDIATIDENNGTVTLKRGSLKDNSQVTAKGIDINDNISAADTESVSGTLPAGAEGIPSGGATGAGGSSGAGGTGGDEGNYTPKFNLNDSFGYLYVTQDNPSTDDNNVKIRAEVSKPGRISRDFNAVFKVKYDDKEYDLAVAGGNGQQLFVALLDPAKSGYDNAVANNGQYFSWHNAGLVGNKNSLPATVEALYQATGQSRGYYKDIQISLTNGQSKAYKDITSGDVPETNGRPDGKPLYDYLKKVEAIEKIVSQGAISNSAIQEIEFKNEPNSEIKLYADTIEPGTGGNKLDVRVYTEGSDQSGVFEYKLRNYNERTDITVEKTPNKVTLTPESDGSMKVVPNDKHNEIVLSYVDESGRTKEARLTKGSNGVWTDSSNTGDFEINGGTIKIKADSLRDNLKDSVIAKAKQPMEGSKYYTYSDVAKATPGADPQAYNPNNDPAGSAGSSTPASPKPTVPAPAAPTLSELPKTSLDDAMNNIQSKPNAGRIYGDLAERQGLIRSYSAKGVQNLDKFMKEKGGMLKTGEHKDQTIKYSFSGDQDNILRINGSVGVQSDNTAYSSKGFELDMRGGDDVVSITNYLGSVKSLQRSKVDLGAGHDVLLVGSANDEMKLYIKPNETDITKRYQYDFIDDGENQPAGYTLVKNVGEIDKEGNDDTIANAYQQGGRITNADVIGGEGNDAVIVDGTKYADNPAVGAGANINLGAGDDSLIIAQRPLVTIDGKRVSSRFSTRGTIASNKDYSGLAPWVDMGDGNDFVQASGMDRNAKVLMGNGNDVTDLLFIRGAGTLLDMGAGDDKVIIKGEARDGALINLGAGNDRIEYTAGSVAFKSNDVVFDTKVNGGAGYDVFVLKAPSQQGGGFNGFVFKDAKHTHLSTENLANIEEIRMEQGTAIDIKAIDLLTKGMSKLKIIAEGHLAKGSIGNKDARVVDLSTDSNSDGNNNSDSKNLGKFTKVADQTEYGIDYEVYRAGSSEVWIQKEYFTVI
ncbi:Ig-like domain-containing protein [Ursidibacter arcticus]